MSRKLLGLPLAGNLLNNLAATASRLSQPIAPNDAKGGGEAGRKLGAACYAVSDNAELAGGEHGVRKSHLIHVRVG